MSVLGRRVVRLEGRGGPDLPSVAVVTDHLPQAVTSDWALALLTRYGWAGNDLAVWVIDGDPAVLVPPISATRLKGDAELIWLNSADHYPHAMIVSGAVGVMVTRFDTADEFQQWTRDLEKELAA